MENAMQALLIAGKVLIALMILSALVLSFNNLTAYQNTRVEHKVVDEIVEFNKEFDTYDRTNVRGSDIYSLLNKVIDYNKRKTDLRENTEGASIGYSPMEVSINLDGKNSNFAIDKNLLFTTQEYIQNDEINVLDKIIEKAKKLEEKYGTKEISTLASNYTQIFLEDNAEDAEKNIAINAYNKIAKSRISLYNEIDKDSIIRKDVKTYYEFVQFKRARFDCVDRKYDTKTGRIISLSFKFNGNFN